MLLLLLLKVRHLDREHLYLIVVDRRALYRIVVGRVGEDRVHLQQSKLLMSGGVGV